MSSQPPPIPLFATEKHDNSFAKNASTACLAAPLLALGLGMGFQRVGANLSGPNLRVAALAVGGVSCAIVGVGLILGILAILLMKPGGRAGIVFKSLGGMVIIGLLAAIAVPNFVRARSIALARVEAVKEIRQATKDAQRDAAAGSTNSEIAMASVDRFQHALADAATKTTGEDSVIMAASQKYLQKVKAVEADYQNAYRELTAARVLATSNLVDRSQITDRQAAVQKFLLCNEALSNFVSHGRQTYEADLAAAHVSKASIDATLKGYDLTAKPQLALVAQIRGQDARMGQAMLSVLAVLQSDWGHWQYSTTAPHLVFENRESLDRYNECLADIKAAGSEQAVSQRKLVALIQQTPTP